MTQTRPLNLHETLASLPDETQDDLMPTIQATIANDNRKIVVLDDDPTGTQTVHNVAVLTSWSQAVLERELRDLSPAVFVLTNTRSMTSDATEKLNHEIITNLNAASKAVGREFVIVSRSDSTLRGHFLVETNTLIKGLSQFTDAILIMPAFMAGGRYTIGSVHYVAEGNDLIPASETPFAQDAAFGYQHANLREWVVEKTNNHVTTADVEAITLGEIRRGGVDTVCKSLMGLSDETYCVIDAVTERDIEVVTLAILQAEAQGKHFLYRTAASFAAIRAGIGLRPVLTTDELQSVRSGGGLVVVGSYVPKTSAQLDHLLQSGLVTGIEVDVNQLLNAGNRQAEIERVIGDAQTRLHVLGNVAIFTSRALITGDDAESSLAIGNAISESLVTITSALQRDARFIIAKGGITSSDIATKALQVKRANVLGQIIAGIPVWQLDDDCAEPNLIYVVFPGNVGDVDALTQAVAKFDGA